MSYVIQTLHHLFRNVHECLRLWPARTRNNCWLACIGICADLRMQWNVSQQIDAHLTTFPSRSIQTEYVVLVSTVGTDECAHVLNDTQDRHVDFLKQIHASNCVPQCQILRCRNNYGAFAALVGVMIEECCVLTCQLNTLSDRELHIASSRRHVKYQQIQLGPTDFEQ